MESSTIAQLLASALRDDRLIALIGSGASAATRDESREYRGLPTPQEFVTVVARRYSYIDANSMNFNDACDALMRHERRAGLEDALLRHFRVPQSFQTPPAHRILSWLPFSAYLTSNYDQFIERSLERESRPHHLVIDNEDVVRLKRNQVPVIKYHGCVSRPGTMVATRRDYDALDERRQLVRQLISVSLASRTLLVIGHGLGDDDLSRLLNELLGQLREYVPMIFVLRAQGSSKTIPDFDLPYEVVFEDLTTFLSRLLHEYRQQAQSQRSSFFDETWLTSAFFAKLRQSFVLPSETQVIDAFLEHLADEFAARGGAYGVVQNAELAIEGALQERPNYTALRRSWSALAESLEAAKDDSSAAEEVVRDLVSQREGQKASFRAAGRTLVPPDSRILLYSQSQRVLQFLDGVPRGTQSRCELFVSECRPKSPSAYADAISICRALANSNYAMTICPDVVAITLIASGQITQVVMGTHAVYVGANGAPYAFVNTCGSLAVALACVRYDVPLVVVAEQLKVEEVPAEEASDHLYVHQESDLLEGQIGVSELSTERGDVSHTNIGYDLVLLEPNMKVVIPDAVAR